MLNPDLQHCQTKLPWVTSVNVYYLDHLLWGRHISLVSCVTWKSAWPKSCSKPDASTERWELSSSLVQACAILCLLFLEEGSERGSLGWNVWRCGSLQHCKGWTCGLHWQPLRPLCLLQVNTRNLGVVVMQSWTRFWCAQVCLGMLSDGNPTAEYRHGLITWRCGFWRQLNVWSHRLAPLQAVCSTR